MNINHDFLQTRSTIKGVAYDTHTNIINNGEQNVKVIIQIHLNHDISQIIGCIQLS